MRAAVVYGVSDVRYEEYPEPKTLPGTVKIRVRAAGICGSDIPRVLDGSAYFYPIVLGHEFSGEVVEVGEGVKSVSVGDRAAVAPLLPCMRCEACLCGDYALCGQYGFIGSREQGGFADFVVAPEASIVRFDEAVSFEQGALFEPAAVALHGIFSAKYSGGGSVAILGGGTIGLMTAQWAKIFGASSVTVFDLDDERLELAKRLGADCTVGTSQDGWREKAAEITDGKGFDWLFETAGSPATIRMGLELAANKAAICLIGTPHAEVTIDSGVWMLINRKELTLAGSWNSYSAPYPGREWRLTAHYFGTGQLKYDEAMIFQKRPMSEAAEAFALFRTPGAVRGKILLVNN